MATNKFDFGQKVRVIRTQQEFTIVSIKLMSHGFIYIPSEGDGILEDDLELVIPKNKFYLYVKPNGVFYNYMLDDNFRCPQGKSHDTDLYSLTKVENVFVELPLITESAKKKLLKSKVETDDEDEDWRRK